MKLFSTFQHNPFIAQALRRRRIGWQVVAALVLAALAYCPAGLFFITWLSTTLLLKNNHYPQEVDRLAQWVFYPTTLLLLILVTLFAPVLAVGAIAGERQRQTLHLLLITLLPSRTLVWGKLIAALLDIFILIAAVWPVILLSAILGAISLIELGVVTLLLVTTAIAFTNLGLFVSCRSKSITNAAMLTYGVVVPGFLIGPFLGMFLVTLVNLANMSSGKLLSYGWWLAASLNPVTAAVLSYVFRQESDGIILAQLPEFGYIIYPWVVYIIFYGFLAWLLFEATAHHLDQAGEM